jgi:hypothetical protein
VSRGIGSFDLAKAEADDSNVTRCNRDRCLYAIFEAVSIGRGRRGLLDVLENHSFDGTMIWESECQLFDLAVSRVKKCPDCGQGSAIARTYCQGLVQGYASDLTVVQGEQAPE